MPKTAITMIQDENGATRKVRVGDTVIPVLVAAPIPGVGCMNFSLTIGDVEVAFERDAPAATPESAEA